MTATGQPHLLSTERARDLAEMFAVLSDPNRVRLLHTLAQAEQTTGQLAQALGVSASAVSHQLRVLRVMRLVTSRRDGRHVWHCLADSHVQTLIRQGLEHAGEPAVEDGPR